MTSIGSPWAAFAAILSAVVAVLGGSSGHTAASGDHRSISVVVNAETSSHGASVTATYVPRRSQPLAGKVVGIDPGHNGRSYTDPSFINHLVYNGREEEACDTTGTETDAGYTEAEFNYNVASYLYHDLRAEGAKVVMTRWSNTGIGPCITTRAQIINRAHANVAVDIHADGGPASGRGFAILTPVADGPNDKIISSSLSFAKTLRSKFLAGTGMPLSTYDGTDGLQPRDDLAGLNLATEPKVLIECGNMRNATDARLLSSSAFQKQAASAMASAITSYLTR